MGAWFLGPITSEEEKMAKKTGRKLKKSKKIVATKPLNRY